MGKPAQRVIGGVGREIPTAVIVYPPSDDHLHDATLVASVVSSAAHADVGKRLQMD